MKFTDVYLKNLKPEEKKYYIREANGFTVRVMPSGAKTWLFVYTINGKRKEMNLGSYPEVKIADARVRYGEAYGLLKNGKDPQAKEDGAVKVRTDLTFGELAKEYITENVEGQLDAKSVYTIKRILLGSKGKGKAKVDDLKEWRKRKVSTITTEDAAKLLKLVSERAPASARNLLKTVRPVFTYAIPRQDIPVIMNPFLLPSVKTFLSKPVKSRLEPTVKNRTLSEDEIKYVWETLPRAKGSLEVKNAIRLMLLTGQRPSEVLGLHSEEVDGSWWILPKERTKARLDKNRADHSIYLVPEALRIIGGKKGLIFESPVKTKGGKPLPPQPISVNAVGHMLRDNNYLGLPPWGAHDLRRTCRTFMSDIDGITVKAAEAVINHAKEGTKKNYDHHRYLRQIESALTLWRDKLVEMVGGDLVSPLPENVISMESARLKSA